MITYQTVTPAALYPITTDEAVEYCNAQGVGDENLIDSLIAAATEWAEDYTGRAFINRTYKAFIDKWPTDTRGYQLTALALPKPPLVSVTHIKSYSDADAATTFSSTSYFVDANGSAGRIVLRNGEAWPEAVRAGNAIEIQWVAGYGAAASSVPNRIKVALMLLVSHWYDIRQVASIGEVVSSIPLNVESLLDSEKFWAV